MEEGEGGGVTTAAPFQDILYSIATIAEQTLRCAMCKNLVGSQSSEWRAEAVRMTGPVASDK